MKEYFDELKFDFQGDISYNLTNNKKILWNKILKILKIYIDF